MTEISLNCLPVGMNFYLSCWKKSKATDGFPVGKRHVLDLNSSILAFNDAQHGFFPGAAMIPSVHHHHHHHHHHHEP